MKNRQTRKKRRYYVERLGWLWLICDRKTIGEIDVARAGTRCMARRIARLLNDEEQHERKL